MDSVFSTNCHVSFPQISPSSQACTTHPDTKICIAAFLFHRPALLSSLLRGRKSPISVGFASTSLPFPTASLQVTREFRVSTPHPHISIDPKDFSVHYGEFPYSPLFTSVGAISISGGFSLFSMGWLLLPQWASCVCILIFRGSLVSVGLLPISVTFSHSPWPASLLCDVLSCSHVCGHLLSIAFSHHHGPFPIPGEVPRGLSPSPQGLSAPQLPCL